MDFANSLENVSTELEHLELRVRLDIWRWRISNPKPNDLQPFYISEKEIDSLLNRVPGRPAWSTVQVPQELEIQAQEASQRLTEKIAAQRTCAVEQGIPLRLDRLHELFSLTRFD